MISPLEDHAAQLSRRVLARVIGGAIWLVLSVVAQIGPLALLAAGGGGAAAAAIGLLVLVLAISSWTLWLALAKAQSPGYKALGLVACDNMTGVPAGGKFFLRSLLQGVVGVFTFGIGEPIISYVSYADGRTWFDRVAGTVVLRTASGTSPDPLPWPEQPKRPAVAPIGLPGTPPVDDGAAREPDFFGEATRPRPSVQAAVPVASDHAPIQQVPGAPPAGQWNPNAEADVAQPAPAVAHAGSGLITSTPWGAAPPPLPAQPERPRSVIRSMAPVPAADHTVLDPSLGAPAVHRVRFDDGVEHELDAPLVVGRDPVVPVSHPNGVPVPVQDPEMQVSKTHLVIVDDGAGMAVVDLQSTNGVRVAVSGGRPQRIPVGTATSLPPGSRVHFGSRWFEVAT